MKTTKSTKPTELPKQFERLKQAFTKDKKYTPPESPQESAANAYRRGANAMQIATGRRPKLPPWVKEAKQ